MKIILNKELTMDYSVDQAILDQNFKIVILKFTLNIKLIVNNIKSKHLKLNKMNRKSINFFVIDAYKVKEFNFMYEIKNFITLILYFKNRRIFIDAGTGDNNKIVKFSIDRKKFNELSYLTFKNCSKGKNYFIL